MTLHNLYYETGFFKMQLENLPQGEILKLRLWNEIYSTDWIKDEAEQIYKSIPSWYVSSGTQHKKESDGSNRSEYERHIGKELFDKTPSTLISIGEDIIKSSTFDFFRKYYKKCSLKYVDMWNGAENIPYHHDTINGCDTLILIYLSDETMWDGSWGGTIWMKKELEGDLPIYQKEIIPHSGTMLVINNANPLIYHKILPMKTNSINRYTFSFIYNWD